MLAPTPVLATIGGTGTTADFVAAVSAAGVESVSASVSSDGAIVFTHSTGGSIRLTNNVGTPVTTAGFNLNVKGVTQGFNNSLKISIVTTSTSANTLYLLQKIEEALQGHTIGAQIDLHLEPEEAFGDYDENKVFLEDRARFPKELEEGHTIEGHRGREIHKIVVDGSMTRSVDSNRGRAAGGRVSIGEGNGVIEVLKGHARASTATTAGCRIGGGDGVLG